MEDVWDVEVHLKPAEDYDHESEDRERTHTVANLMPVATASAVEPYYSSSDEEGSRSL